MGNGGKGKILSMLGGVILPASGKDKGTQRVLSDFEITRNIHIPSHLRVLHVEANPLFITGSLYKNLTYGLPPGTDSMEQVLQVCTAIGLTDETIEHVMSNRTLCWLQVLSQSQCMLVQIARALLANPDVLLLHKPTLSLNNDEQTRIYQLLREHVDERGICQSRETFLSRRPKTVIITTKGLPEVKQFADTIWLANRVREWPVLARIHPS